MFLGEARAGVKGHLIAGFRRCSQAKTRARARLALALLWNRRLLRAHNILLELHKGFGVPFGRAVKTRGSTLQTGATRAWVSETAHPAHSRPSLSGEELVQQLLEGILSCALGRRRSLEIDR